MKILGIETSCDDTAAAVVKVANPPSPRLWRARAEFSVLSNVSYSQIAIHKKFGGVVPNLASRAHLEKIMPTIKEALSAAKTKLENIDLIAVTRGPGLMPSLLIGVNAARALAYRFGKSITGVNHIEGHIYSNWLTNKKIEFPALILTVSGGHTELVLMRDYGKYKIVGRTLDDAAGEAFDKTARLLGLGFPGGPQIAAEAAKCQMSNVKCQKFDIKLPRPMINSNNYNFSFSGLKTAVLYLYNDLTAQGVSRKLMRSAIAAEVQQAIVDVLVSKTIKAVEKFNPKTLMVSGGVSANKKLRETMAEKAAPYKIPLFIPDFAYTADNAAMIAVAGYFCYLKKNPTAGAWKKLEASANLEL